MSVTVAAIFPFVSFTNTEGKKFVIERERILHSETYATDGGFDHSKTFVNFKSPNCQSKSNLHAIIDMPIDVFREVVLRPAWEGDPNERETNTIR